MKIIMEELDKSVIAISDGGRSVSIVENPSALDFHLAKNAIKNFNEMMKRHLAKKDETPS